MTVISRLIGCIDKLLERAEEMRKYMCLQKCCHDEKMNVDYQYMIESCRDIIEDTVSANKYNETIGDPYIVDMLYNIVMTYGDEFENIKDALDSTLWYNSIDFEDGWSDSSHMVYYLKKLRSGANGCPSRWNKGNPMSTRNIYFTQTSMYILARYHTDTCELRTRMDDLEYELSECVHE